MIGAIRQAYEDWMEKKLYARIRLYELLEGGELVSLLDYPLDHFGACPNVGDTLILEFADHSFLSVVRRYYIEMRGWAVVVRKLERSAQIDSLLRAWHEDDAFDAALDAEEEEEKRQISRREEEKREFIYGKPPKEFALDHWEEPTMERLVKRGVGKHVLFSSLIGCGRSTRDKLKRRGFIKVQSDGSGKKDNLISLTSEGAKAWRNLMNHRKKVEAARKGF